uniref:Saposin B-type domain-containing protein n=1 Tax=Chromera velia CCMP2878 TaxID=1169474 RepID=A0A0G4G2N0_9ALVE|eukprot:Cvel_19981.t1-p1 / transcript=Cvel_19981.t1 / gene=Cvel_19981 / organism=Chromera_velia_CCMP2878 / gene_product=hypothetical protein / transcript_product=hypothetical protein / location=Cvel_scaffold1760:20885-23739(-) / protein_length=868 / sequence_SO=supercontig / SO=protein_coding / is_pseudo=false
MIRVAWAAVSLSLGFLLRVEARGTFETEGGASGRADSLSFYSPSVFLRSVGLPPEDPQDSPSTDSSGSLRGSASGSAKRQGGGEGHSLVTSGEQENPQIALNELQTGVRALSLPVRSLPRSSSVPSGASVNPAPASGAAVSHTSGRAQAAAVKGVSAVQQTHSDLFFDPSLASACAETADEVLKASLNSRPYVAYTQCLLKHPTGGYMADTARHKDCHAFASLVSSVAEGQRLAGGESMSPDLFCKLLAENRKSDPSRDPLLDSLGACETAIERVTDSTSVQTAVLDACTQTIKPEAKTEPLGGQGADMGCKRMAMEMQTAASRGLLDTDQLCDSILTNGKGSESLNPYHFEYSCQQYAKRVLRKVLTGSLSPDNLQTTVVEVCTKTAQADFCALYAKRIVDAFNHHVHWGEGGETVAALCHEEYERMQGMPGASTPEPTEAPSTTTPPPTTTVTPAAEPTTTTPAPTLFPPLAPAAPTTTLAPLPTSPEGPLPSPKPSASASEPATAAGTEVIVHPLSMAECVAHTVHLIASTSGGEGDAQDFCATHASAQVCASFSKSLESARSSLSSSEGSGTVDKALLADVRLDRAEQLCKPLVRFVKASEEGNANELQKAMAEMGAQAKAASTSETQTGSSAALARAIRVMEKEAVASGGMSKGFKEICEGSIQSALKENNLSGSAVDAKCVEALTASIHDEQGAEAACDVLANDFEEHLLSTPGTTPVDPQEFCQEAIQKALEAKPEDGPIDPEILHPFGLQVGGGGGEEKAGAVPISGGFRQISSSSYSERRLKSRSSKGAGGFGGETRQVPLEPEKDNSSTDKEDPKAQSTEGRILASTEKQEGEGKDVGGSDSTGESDSFLAHFLEAHV